MPREWSYEAVEVFLGGIGIVEVELQERIPWRGGTAWTFCATMPITKDFMSVTLDDEVTVEVTRLGKQKGSFAN